MISLETMETERALGKRVQPEGNREGPGKESSA